MTSTDPGRQTGLGHVVLRPTRQRTAVIEAMEAVADFRSAQDIHDLLGRSGTPVGLATVYRTLNALVEAGEVDMLRTEDGEAVFRRCSQTHHHHLVCRSCGVTFEIEGPAVERWTRSIAADHGYSEVSHTLEIIGTCRSCAQAAQKLGAAPP